MAQRFDSQKFNALVAGRRVIKPRLRKPPRQKHPILIERKYTNQLKQTVDFIKNLIDRRLVSRLPTLVDRLKDAQPDHRKDSVGDDMNEVNHTLSAIRVEYETNFDDEKLKKISMQYGIDTSKFNKDQLRAMLTSVLGIDPFIAEPWLLDSLEAWTADNVSLIKSIATQYLDQVERQVFNGFTQGLRWEEIASNLADRYDVAGSRAELIARDQISKLNGQLTENRQTSLGVKKYTWRTSMDERVRDTHREKEGKTFSWDDPPSDTGNPGEDYQCLLGDTLVHSPSLPLRAYRRIYSGNIVSLKTELGSTLRATPNHPILTHLGWKPFDLVDVGDYIFSTPQKVIHAVEEDNQDFHFLFEQVFETLSLLGNKKRVPGSRLQFHTDGVINHQVDVVDIDWKLGPDFKAAFPKKLAEFFFTCADEIFEETPSASAFYLSLLAISCPPKSAVRGLAKCLAFLQRHTTITKDHRLARISLLNTISLQMRNHGSTSNSILLCKCLHTFATNIETDHLFNGELLRIMAWAIDLPTGIYAPSSHLLAQIIGSNVKQSRDLCHGLPLIKETYRISEKLISQNVSSHVYNLETISGWYLAQKHTCGNCRCYAEPNFNSINASSEDEE